MLQLCDDLEEGGRWAGHNAVRADRVEIALSNTSKERVLVGELISTVTLAGQSCQDVIFSDDNTATGQKVYLQLKSGDSYLKTRKLDGAEIFKSFDQRQVRFWLDQVFPVILVIRNSSGEIRWMDIREHLKHVTDNGEKQVRQIEFVGKRFDVMSVRRWRDEALAAGDRDPDCGRIRQRFSRVGTCWSATEL